MMDKGAAGRMKAIEQAAAWLFGVSLALPGGVLLVDSLFDPAHDFIEANPWVLHLSLCPAAVLCAGGTFLGTAALASLSLESYRGHRARGLGLGAALAYAVTPTLVIVALIALTIWAGTR